MPLESCMILLDCSEYMRNGDYVPTRLEAQQDAANLLVGYKTQSHPESTVGIAAGTQLLVSPTDDVGKILSAIHGLSLNTGCSSTVLSSSPTSVVSGAGGVLSKSVTVGVPPADVCAAVQVASLALKHRRNKNGSQRIVLFVGSPVDADVRSLQKTGRQLKKNNVAIDVVCLGELEHNETVLRELVDAANGTVAASAETGDDAAAAAAADQRERTCHLVTIPAGVLPSDVLANSPLLAIGGAAFTAAATAFGGAGAGGGGGVDSVFADYGGVDPNMDPELAMALRVSMEEERARQERAAAAAAAAAATAGTDAEMTDASAAADSAAAAAAVGSTDMGGLLLSEEEALLQQALAMSMNENEPAPSTTTAPSGADNSNQQGGGGEEEMDMEDEDAAMQMALQMSMQPDNDMEGKEESSTVAPAANQFQDVNFVHQLLGSAAGGAVDPNDPQIQQALQAAAAAAAKKKEEDDKKEKDSENKE